MLVHYSWGREESFGMAKASNVPHKVRSHDRTWYCTYWYGIARGSRNRAPQGEIKKHGSVLGFGETQKGGVVIAEEVESAASLCFVASGVLLDKASKSATTT